MTSSGDDSLLPPGITLERATLADAEVVLAILRTAAHWLLSRGIEQWRPEQFRMQPLAESIGRGEVCLARRDGEPAGTLTISWADPRIWGARPDDAGYVHGLAIDPRFGGAGLGRALLEWAARQAASAGKTYLRLDCMAGNPALRVYYECAGFTHVGDVSGSTWSASLYEKAV